MNTALCPSSVKPLGLARESPIYPLANGPSHPPNCLPFVSAARDAHVRLGPQRESRRSRMEMSALWRLTSHAGVRAGQLGSEGCSAKQAQILTLPIPGGS